MAPSKLVVTGGHTQAIVFDRRGVRRRYDWVGDVQYSPDPDDPVFETGDGDRIQNPFRTPLRDRDPYDSAPVDLTNRGPRQPGPEDSPRDQDEVSESNILEEYTELENPGLDLYDHIPPKRFPPWRKDLDIHPDSENEEDIETLLTHWDPCDIFHPLGPFGPFVEPLNVRFLFFPRIPYIGPFQSPIEQALEKALRKFGETIQQADSTNTLDELSIEEVLEDIPKDFGQEVWDWTRHKLEDRYFEGDLTLDTACDFVTERPWVTGTLVIVGLSGYGLYLGREYERKGKLRLDIGPIDFEYDDDTGFWSVEFKIRLRF